MHEARIEDSISHHTQPLRRVQGRGKGKGCFVKARSPSFRPDLTLVEPYTVYT